MQLLRSTETKDVPSRISFACPNGCRANAPNAVQGIQVSLQTEPGGEEGVMLLRWDSQVSCPCCGERIAPGAVEEAVRRELGPLVR